MHVIYLSDPSAIHSRIHQIKISDVSIVKGRFRTKMLKIKKVETFLIIYDFIKDIF